MIYERLDQLSEAGDALMITELDIAQDNLSERADDYEDYLRLVYSHPMVNGIILWEFMDTKHAGKNGDIRRVLFENELNEKSQPYSNLNEGTHYPLYPNKAGMVWINLVQNEWTSNEIITLKNNPFLSRNLFEGDYQFTHRDSAGNVIGQINQTISNSECALVNLIPDGEFDDNVLGSEWRINGDYQFHWDGYIKDGLIIYGHTITVLDISEYITEGEEYIVKLYVKAVGEEQVNGQYVIIQDFNPRLLHGELVNCCRRSFREMEFVD